MWFWRPNGGRERTPQDDQTAGAAGAGGVARRPPSGDRVADPHLVLPGIMRSSGPPPLVAPTQLRPRRLGRELRDLLSSLGRTPGDVAAALEAVGVRAAPHDRSHTPVSNFLAAVIGADPAVKSVTVDDCSVTVHLHTWWRWSVVADLPPVVHEFLAAFDRCCYPSLLPPGHRAEGPGPRSD